MKFNSFSQILLWFELFIIGSTVFVSTAAVSLDLSVTVGINCIVDGATVLVSNLLNIVVDEDESEKLALKADEKNDGCLVSAGFETSVPLLVAVIGVVTGTGADDLNALKPLKPEKTLDLLSVESVVAIGTELNAEKG